MSRFFKYINEGLEKMDKTVDDIIKDSRYFIKDLLNNPNRLLFSGRKTDKNFVKKKIRKDRKSKNTPYFIHNLLDKSFKEKFGVKVRSEGIFVTANEYDACSYGNVYVIFPVGKNYTYIWSDGIYDLYTKLKNNINYKLGIPYISLENLDKKLHNDGIIVYVNNKEQSVEEYKLFLKGDKNVKYSVDYGKARVITKEDYEKVVEKILEEFISTYSKSNKLADLPPEEEITLISDYVWMVNYDDVFLENSFMDCIKEKY